jgi:hypothetical protein
MRAAADNTAYLCGDEAFIEIPVPWKPPAQGAVYSVVRGTPPKMDSPASQSAPKPPRETFSVDAGNDLYAVEADDVADAISNGRPVRVTPEFSIGNMRVLDEMRRQIATT